MKDEEAILSLRKIKKKKETKSKKEKRKENEDIGMKGCAREHMLMILLKQ